MATWRDVTIEKYEKIAALQQQNLNEVDLIAAVIAVLDGKTVKEVEEMPYATLLLKARGLRFLNTQPLTPLVKGHYQLNGVKYNVTLKPQELTTAQFIDFQVRATEAPDDLAGLLSIFLIPDGHNYNEGYYSDDVREVIYKYMAVEDGMALSAFFFALWKRSIHRLLRQNKKQYLTLKLKRKKTQQELQLMEAIKNLIDTIKRAEKYF